VPGPEGGENERHGFGEADEPEREWIAGQIVDLPADHRTLHLNADREREEPEDVALEIWVAERCVRVGAGQTKVVRAGWEAVGM
jgi:hypothetical protein